MEHLAPGGPAEVEEDLNGIKIPAFENNEGRDRVQAQERLVDQLLRGLSRDR